MGQVRSPNPDCYSPVVAKAYPFSSGTPIYRVLTQKGTPHGSASCLRLLSESPEKGHLAPVVPCVWSLANAASRVPGDLERQWVA